MKLTKVEREALHHAVLWDVMHPKESVPTVHAAAESILAARVAEALRDVVEAIKQAIAEVPEAHGEGWLPLTAAEMKREAIQTAGLTGVRAAVEQGNQEP